VEARLLEQQQELKRAIYERMSPRRRRFVDKIGFEAWDPFSAPNDPIDIRTDATRKFTAHDLVKAFMRSVPHKAGKEAYSQGAFDLANGIIAGTDRYLGMLDFARFYLDFLREQGLIDDDTPYDFERLMEGQHKP
jgi:hypothetical protein